MAQRWRKELIHTVFTTERFLQAAIESFPDWGLNQRPLNSVQRLQRTDPPDHQFNSHSEPNFHSHSNLVPCQHTDGILAISQLPCSFITFVLIENLHREKAITQVIYIYIYYIYNIYKYIYIYLHI